MESILKGKVKTEKLECQKIKNETINIRAFDTHPIRGEMSFLHVYIVHAKEKESTIFKVTNQLGLRMY